MTEQREEWQKRIKKGPFEDEPFTEEHKQRVIQTVQQMSQPLATKPRPFRLKHMLITFAACSTVIAAAWWLLPINGLSTDSPNTMSIAETSLSTDAMENIPTPRTFSMDQQSMEKSMKNETNKNYASEESLNISNDDVSMKELIQEADLIAEVRITNPQDVKQNEGGKEEILLPAQVEQILVPHEKGVPSELNIRVSESLSPSDLSLIQADRVILFMNTTDQPKTYDLVGQTKGIYVVSADNLVSSIQTDKSGSSQRKEIPYSEFINQIKALAEQS